MKDMREVSLVCAWPEANWAKLTSPLIFCSSHFAVILHFYFVAIFIDKFQTN